MAKSSKPKPELVVVYLREGPPQSDPETHLVITTEPQTVPAALVGENSRRDLNVIIETPGDAPAETVTPPLTAAGGTEEKLDA